MNKSELIETFAAQRDISHKRAEEVVNMIFNSMSEAMINGDRIEIRGFGSFVVKEYGAYTGRNPKSGEPIEVQPKKLPFSRLARNLRNGFWTANNHDAPDCGH